MSAALIAAARAALEALRNLDHACRLADADEELSGHVDGSLLDAAHYAIAAAQAALAAAPEQQAEPVYWQWRRKGDPWRLEAHTFNCEVKATTDDSEVRALYAAPQAAAHIAQPLTDEQIDALWREPMSADWEHREFARAIEKAHGIGAQEPKP